MCSSASDRTFGPRVDPSCRAFDFTPLFEDVVFGCVPSAVFLTLLPFCIAILTRAPVRCSVRSSLLLAKLVSLAGIFGLHLALLILRSQSSITQTRASIVADVLTVIGIAGVAWLSYSSHQRSLRPSTPLLLYLSALSVLDIPRVKTLWLLEGSRAEAATLTCMLVLLLASLLLESAGRQSIVVEKKATNAPEEYSGLWTRTAFIWLTTTFRAGYSKVLVQDDLPILDTRLQSDALHQKLVGTWEIYDHQARNSLIKACFQANLVSFLSAVPPRLCLSAFTFAQPLLINTTVSYVGKSSPDASFGRALIGAWALAFLGVACSNALSSYQSTRFLTKVKGGLIGLVYQETLKARTKDLGEITAVSLMGTDSERIGHNFLRIHKLWASPIEVIVAIWLLERQVFMACLAPLLVILASIWINVPVSNAAKKAQIAWIEKVQERLRVTSTMLNDMKAVKMLGLPLVMSNILQGLRQVEVQTSKVYLRLLVWNVLLSECPKNISPLATFAATVIISLYWRTGTLLTAQAFTSIALISLLTNPVIQLVQIMPQLLQCVGSFERIQNYCNRACSATDPGILTRSGEFTASSINFQPLSLAASAQQTDNQKHVITFRENSFAWEKSEPPFLKEISLNVLSGRVTVCIGAVGSGKSMLLESILGETMCINGPQPKRTSHIAYCAQQPWLENGTIQANVTSVYPYEPNWYRTVIATCGLKTDLQVLEQDDQTVISSNGANLSGGQKQRIALARAVYSRKNLVILDDIFSGMDAHTAVDVSQHLLGTDGLLRQHGTTVIMTTHNYKLVRLADTMVVLENGQIAQIGPPERLLADARYASNSGHTVEDRDVMNPRIEDNDIFQEGNNVPKSLAHVTRTRNDDHDPPDLRRKNGDWSVYNYYYAKAGGTPVIGFLFAMAIWIFCTEFATVWLKWWSQANELRANKDLGFYLGLYAFFCIFGVFAIAISCWVGIVDIISRSALCLHSDLLASTMKAPLQFFTTTDTGTLINRFSQDMELIDMNLPIVMINYAETAMSAAAKGIILVVFSRYLATMAPFVVAILYLLQLFYLKTSRQVRLLEIEAKAPLYTHFIETVAGVATIRAFGWEPQHQQRNHRFIDQSQRPAYLQYCIQNWLGFVLDMLVTIIATVLVAIVVTWKDDFDAGNVGVSLVMVMTFSTVLMKMIRAWTQLESSIGAVARVKRFVSDTKSEETGDRNVVVPQDWPTQGNIEFKDLVAAHAPSGNPVIRGVSLSIRSSEHVALCGRSGSGETSMILALLQMIETRGGQITVDDIDLSTVLCTDIRSRFNVIPQDPILLPGTMRFNIDPFRNASDEDIKEVLERVRLWPVIAAQGGLSKELDPNTWSAGQKQLLCLARAMVRKSKVLILDEAMSSVDGEMEALMQDIIDMSFKDCTVLAVMHRLTHVKRYDKVAVLDNGRLLEFDAPETLLANYKSSFANLYRKSVHTH